MEIYIALLRGINVSGHNLIKMDDLKVLLHDLGYKNVTTYIQSGNIVFQYKKQADDKVAATIKKAIAEKFRYEVPVLVKKQAALEYIFQNNPFVLAKKGTNFQHVTLLDKEPSKEVVDKINGDFGSDEYIIEGSNVFLFCPNGYGNTKLTNTFWENKLKCKATTRNWKTITQLVQMCENLLGK